MLNSKETQKENKKKTETNVDGPNATNEKSAIEKAKPTLKIKKSTFEIQRKLVFNIF